MQKSRRKIVWIGLLLFLIGVLVVGFIYRHSLYRFFQSKYRTYGNSGGLNNMCPNCAAYFPDVVSVMERAYKKERLKPGKRLSDLELLYKRGVLVKIPDDKRYVIADMTYSLPYVLPKVIPFLQDLAMEYTRRLEAQKLPLTPFVITSGTRSIESAKRLSEINGIALEDSHHLYGKTLDISYKQFGSNRAEQVCLIEAMYALRQQGRCYVKFEKKGALHLTVR
jgi:hypothetical protein